MHSPQRAIPSPAPLTASNRPVRILYLDDDDMDRQLMKYFLCTKSGFDSELTSVSSIAEARSVLAEGKTDVFVIDNRMPGVDSFRDTFDALDAPSIAARIVVVSSETASRAFRDLDDLPRPPDAIVDKQDIMAAVDRGVFGPFGSPS